MKEYTVLTINPGSTGTKIGLVKGDTVVLDLNVDTLPGEFDGFASYAEQVPVREKKIMDMLSVPVEQTAGFSPASIMASKRVFTVSTGLV